MKAFLAHALKASDAFDKIDRGCSDKTDKSAKKNNMTSGVRTVDRNSYKTGPATNDDVFKAETKNKKTLRG